MTSYWNLPVVSLNTFSFSRLTITLSPATNGIFVIGQSLLKWFFSLSKVKWYFESDVTLWWTKSNRLKQTPRDSRVFEHFFQIKRFLLCAVSKWASSNNSSYHLAKYSKSSFVRWEVSSLYSSSTPLEKASPFSRDLWFNMHTWFCGHRLQILLFRIRSTSEEKILVLIVSL